jgi:hypothetical protein
MQTRCAAKEEPMTEKSLARMTVSHFSRLGLPVSPLFIDLMSAADTPWHEDPSTVRAALARGRERQRRLSWVRAQMLFRLTPVERQCIELYYFEAKNYREAAAELGVNSTSVYRAVQRGIRKLKAAARRNPPRRRPAKGRRRRV